MSQKRSLSLPAPGDKRIRLESLMGGRMSKTALVSILQDLHTAGLLAQRYNIKQVRRAVHAHAGAQTPFAQSSSRSSLKNQLNILIHLHCCGTCVLCQASLLTFVQRTVQASNGACLKWVLYQDGVVPGNLFRPDKARKVE